MFLGQIEEGKKYKSKVNASLRGVFFKESGRYYYKSSFNGVTEMITPSDKYLKTFLVEEVNIKEKVFPNGVRED